MSCALHAMRIGLRLFAEDIADIADIDIGRCNVLCKETFAQDFAKPDGMCIVCHVPWSARDI